MKKNTNERDYSVSLEINIVAKSPLQAAKELQDWLKEYETNFQYYVQDCKTKELFSVDLEESDEDAVLPVIRTDYTPIIE